MVKTSISLLQEICAKNHRSQPKYDIIKNGSLSGDNLFEYKVEAIDRTANGIGKSKQKAKNQAAINLIEQIKHLDGFKGMNTLNESLNNNNDVEEISINFINKLNEICVKEQWLLPVYAHKGSSGVAHAPIFYTKCTFKEFVVEAESHSKKSAKNAAAEMMYKKIEHLIIDRNESLTEPAPEPKHYTIDEIIDYIKTKKKNHRKWNMNFDFKNHFKKLTNDERNQCANILQINDTNREKFYLLRDLLKFQIIPMKIDKNICIEVNGTFDCVFIENETEIWDNIINYFRIMLL